MATTAPTFRLISPGGTRMEAFIVSSYHQMLIQMFSLTATGWQQGRSGWMWKGAARRRWADLRREGWQRTV